MLGMQMMLLFVEKFHICICGGIRFHYLDHLLATSLTHLRLVKEQNLTHDAQKLFPNTCINVTTDGRPHLGLATGSTNYITQYISSKISTWVHELQLLSSFAVTQPHVAYSTFTHGLISKWLFIARTIPNVDDLFQPLEECIRHSFIPAVTDHSPLGNLERYLLTITTRMDGMDVINSIRMCEFEFSASNKITKPLQSLLLWDK